VEGTNSCSEENEIGRNLNLKLAPAASLAISAAVSSIGVYVQFCAADDGRKNRLKHVKVLQN